VSALRSSLSVLFALGLLSQGAQARQPDPVPPPAPVISDAVALARVPSTLRAQEGLHLVLDRQTRQLMVFDGGHLKHRFPAAVGTEGWETPAGTHQVLEKVSQPVWQHPGNGNHVGPGPANPLGINGCTVAGFHGTPHRWTVGRAVSHGCVRLFEENVQKVFDLVEVGTLVTVLP